MTALCLHRAATVTGESDRKLNITVDDPLILFLIKKSLALSKADTESYQHWRETRLALFEDKPLVFNDVWSEENVAFWAGEAATESNWLEVYAEAAAAENRQITGDEPSPFER